MEVTTITVTRKRSKQPEQYGSASAELTVAANVEAGEDWDLVARDLLVKTRALVYENLGMKLPAGVAGADKSSATEEVSVETKTEEKEPKKRRGRPPKNKDKDADDLPGVDVGSDDDKSDDSAPSGDGQDVTVPDDSADESAEGVPANQDELQAEFKALIKANKVDVGLARKVLVDTAGVIKTGDVPDDKIAEVWANIQKVIN